MSSENHAFPRQSRLLKPAEFKHVFNRPVVSSDHLFRVFARPAFSPQFRLGIAVSKKVDRRAVVRNHIKRHIRESFRIDLDTRREEREAGADIVVVASPPAAKAAGQQLRQSLAGHWQQITRKLDKVSAGQNKQ